MNTQLKKYSFVILISLGLSLAVTSQLFAGETSKAQSNAVSKFQIKEGFYIGAFLVQGSVKGDFNDENFLYTDTTMYSVPNVDNGSGFGIAFGGRSAGGACEISYLKTDHTTNTAWSDIGVQDATLNIVNLDLKLHLTKSRLRPYLQFGFGFPWLTIKNSMYSESYADETFGGVALNIGGGVSYFFTSQWALNAGAVYRWTSFRKVDGVTIEDSLAGSGTNFILGTTYTF